MSRLLARSLACASFAALVAAPAAAQGLGDAAARAKQKRQAEQGKAQPQPKKVFTNEDLPPSAAAPASDDATPGQPAPPAAPEGPGSTGTPPEASGELAVAAVPSDAVERERHERALLEAAWRTRFANARERLAVADAGAWTEGYRIEIYNGVPVRVRTRERLETEEWRRAKQALADLEEEFRRTGLPAGWARE